MIVIKVIVDIITIVVIVTIRAWNRILIPNPEFDLVSLDPIRNLNLLINLELNPDYFFEPDKITIRFFIIQSEFQRIRIQSGFHESDSMP